MSILKLVLSNDLYTHNSNNYTPINQTIKQTNKQTNKHKQHGNFPDVLNNFPDGITFKILSIKHAVQTITRNTKIGQHIIRIWKTELRYFWYISKSIGQ